MIYDLLNNIIFTILIIFKEKFDKYKEKDEHQTLCKKIFFEI